MSASPLLDQVGAVPAEGLDAGVAAHYGDPLREQRLLVEGLAAVDLSHRGVVTVTGPDRLRWLHSMTTQHLSDLAPRTSAESLVLSPKGHVEHALHVVDDGTTTWLTVEPGTAPALVAWLESMQFLLRVEVADRTGEYAVVGEPHRRESAPGEPLAWCDPWPGPVRDTATYGPVEGHPGQDWRWRELIVPRAELSDAVGDRPLAGSWALEALRVAAWRPRLRFDTDHRTIAHEVDWLRTAVHLHKGCYRGQETIARVHNLGRPPRRLAFLHLDGSGHTLPARGAEVMGPARGAEVGASASGAEVGGSARGAEVAGPARVVGVLTSVARHYEAGPIGLALLKRSTPVDAPLTVEGIGASQEPIVTA